METTDFLVIGGGVIGLTIALELRRRHPRAGIVVLEKESDCGQHASGRNSGVLHAGFYYSPDSLKARFTREGNAELTEYCVERGLPINRCGKLVIAQSEAELPQLDRLYARGLTNGVQLEMIDVAAAKEIEPRVRTVERAIFSPTTASVDPGAVMIALATQAEQAGIAVRRDTEYEGHVDGAAQTASGPISYGYLINAAGMYSDRIARQFGACEHYRIVPFKGLYLYGTAEEKLRTNIYPVPDPRFPFLGVHYTIAVDGKVMIGPTAMPAFWREQYEGLSRFRLREFGDVALRVLRLLIAGGAPFRRHAWAELRKYSRGHLARLASSMLVDADVSRYRTWGRPGIRAQLVDLRDGKLEMDFVVERADRSLHVLNAVSPAFTCSFPFARHVVDQVEAVAP